MNDPRRKLQEKLWAKKAFACRDCQVDTSVIDEYYMVHDHLWLAAGMSLGRNGGMLCIGCLESRLGRMLDNADFPSYPINEGVFPASDRLRERLSR